VWLPGSNRVNHVAKKSCSRMVGFVHRFVQPHVSKWLYILEARIFARSTPLQTPAKAAFTSGTWCSWLSRSLSTCLCEHARGVGFNSQCVHFCFILLVSGFMLFFVPPPYQGQSTSGLGLQWHCEGESDFRLIYFRQFGSLRDSILKSSSEAGPETG